MSDLFISYDNEDKARAEIFAKAFEREGWSVFWDKEIPTHEVLDGYIDEELDAAKCIVVLWSELSVTSDEVEKEYEHGMHRNNLVSVLIGQTWLPFGIDRMGSVELFEWDGDPYDVAYRSLLKTIEAHLNDRPAAQQEPLQERAVADPSSAASKPPTSPLMRALQANKEFVLAGLVGVFVLGMLFLISKMVDESNREESMEEFASERRTTRIATPMPSAPPSSGGVVGGMAPLANDLKRKGFISYGSPTVGKLSRGKTASHVLTLGGQAEYVIAGACSNDCNDLDLVVTAANGSVVGVYEQVNSREPTVNVVPHTTGTYRVDVRMVDCTSGSCTYGISIFEKRGARGH